MARPVNSWLLGMLNSDWESYPVVVVPVPYLGEMYQAVALHNSADLAFCATVIEDGPTA